MDLYSMDIDHLCSLQWHNCYLQSNFKQNLFHLRLTKNKVNWTVEFVNYYTMLLPEQNNIGVTYCLYVHTIWITEFF
jgi:hypothetical protein